MEELRENYEHFLTLTFIKLLSYLRKQKNKEERPERCREECKFVVIRFDLFWLRIATFILPTKTREWFQIVSLYKDKILTDN